MNTSNGRYTTLFEVNENEDNSEMKKTKKLMILISIYEVIQLTLAIFGFYISKKYNNYENCILNKTNNNTRIQNNLIDFYAYLNISGFLTFLLTIFNIISIIIYFRKSIDIGKKLLGIFYGFFGLLSLYHIYGASLFFGVSIKLIKECDVLLKILDYESTNIILQIFLIPLICFIFVYLKM